MKSWRNLIIEAAESAIRLRKALIVAPPGFGKTRVAFEIAHLLGRTELSVILHRKPLYEQWERRGRKESVNVNVISASADPLKIKRSHYLLFVDEAHHLVSDTFGDLLACLNAQYLFGLTATPPHKNKQLRLLKLFFPKTVVVQPPQRDKPVVHIIYTNWHFHNDFERGMYPERNKLIERLAKGKTLVLTRLVSHQLELYEAYNFDLWRPPDRTPVPGSVGFVGTYSYVSEGIHLDDIQTVILATPSQSIIRLVQSIGRGNSPECNDVYVILDEDCNRLQIPLYQSLEILALPFEERVLIDPDKPQEIGSLFRKYLKKKEINLSTIEKHALFLCD